MNWITAWKTKRKYIKEKKDIIKAGNHSELLIDRPDGKDRCSLMLASYDTPQWESIKKSLANRGVNSRLLVNFHGGGTEFKFNLTPEIYKDELDISKDFDRFISFLDRCFVYGKPVDNLDFFTDEEKEMLMKWYK